MERLKGLTRNLPVFAKNPILQYPRDFGAVAVLGLLSSLLEGIGIGLLIPLLALLMGGYLPAGIPEPIERAARLAADFDTSQQVLAIGGFVILLIFLKGLVQGINISLISYVQGKLVSDLRVALGRKVLELDYSFYFANEKSRLLPILMTDCWYASETIRFFLMMVPAVMTLVVFGGLLLYISPPLGLVALLGALSIQASLILVERRQRRLSRDLVPIDHEYGDRMVEIINATKVTRVFGQEEHEARRFSDVVERLRRAVLRIDTVTAVTNPLTDVLIACTFVAILLLSPQFETSLPVTTGFLILLARAQAPVQTLNRARTQIATHSAALDQLRWLLGQQPQPALVRVGAPVPAIDRPIRFDDVSYTYPGGAVGLANASFTMRDGAATALIGKSGAGKTSLVNLLTALVQPDSGEIWLGDERLSTLSPVQWRARLAVAGQDIDLLEGSIADNIAYGRADASRDELMHAVEAAGAADFIRRLPDGLDTRIDFNASGLSGGQRQRIGLARALVRRPDLLILDEATNAVDAPTEREIIKLLLSRGFFRSALFISHRRSTISACEDGIVLSGGKVVEFGPLSSLKYFAAMH